MGVMQLCLRSWRAPLAFDDQQQMESLHLHGVPAEIQFVLDSFASVCAPPTELPLARNCDHRIPLVEGAWPVNIRSYRY